MNYGSLWCASSERTALFRRWGIEISIFFYRVLVGNSISDLVELIPSCSRLHSNEVLEVTLPLAERVTELIGVRANNFVTSSVTSAVHVDLAPAVSIESVSAIFFFFFFNSIIGKPWKIFVASTIKLMREYKIAIFNLQRCRYIIYHKAKLRL